MSRTLNIKGLGSNGPYPDYSEKLMLFGQFVGDWDIVSVKSLNPSGVAFSAPGEVHFGWILEGRAIQDVWMTYDEKLKRPVPVGTTIRLYDAVKDKWQSIWILAMLGMVRIFKVQQTEGEIIMETRGRSGNLERWVFSDITSHSFTWHSDESYDGGRTWVLTEKMSIRKKIED
jgi:hypothetical protein